MNLFLKIAFIVLYELFVFVLSYVIWHHQDFFDMRKNTATIKLAQSPVSAPKIKPPVVWKEIKEENSIPQSFKLEVPFTPQAPYGNWANPWQEFCEEAVILMTAKYYKSRPFSKNPVFLPQSVTTQFLSAASDTTRKGRDKSQSPISIIPKNEAAGLMFYIMSREKKLLGYHENTGAEDIAKTIKSVFGIEAKIVSAEGGSASGGEEMGIEKIKEEILRYRPVIIPAAGKRLGNPYFQKGGPFYHTVLVIGYDNSDNTFIVHEPGTRYGREYKYGQQKLFDAMADWSQEKQKVVERKVMVVIE